MGAAVLAALAPASSGSASPLPWHQFENTLAVAIANGSHVTAADFILADCVQQYLPASQFQPAYKAAQHGSVMPELWLLMMCYAHENDQAGMGYPKLRPSLISVGSPKASSKPATTWVLPRLDVAPYTTNATPGPYKLWPSTALISMNGGGILKHLLWTKWTATTASANGEEGNGPVNGQWHKVPGQGEIPVYAWTPVRVTLSSPIKTTNGPVFAVMTITPLLPPADDYYHLKQAVLDVSGVTK